MWALRMLDFGKYKGYFKNHATLIPAYPTSRASGVSGPQRILQKPCIGCIASPISPLSKVWGVQSGCMLYVAYG